MSNKETTIYKIDHLLSHPHKITTYKTEQKFIDFANRICIENEDNNHFAIHNAQDAKDYINEYCDNLAVINFLTREEAEKMILNKECDDVKQQVLRNDLSYVSDIFTSGFKGYINFTNKELEAEMEEQFGNRDNRTRKFKIIK